MTDLVQSIVLVLLAWRCAVLARALRKQSEQTRDLAELTHEAFKSIAFIVEQLSSTPAQRLTRAEQDLERLRLLGSLAKTAEMKAEDRS